MTSLDIQLTPQARTALLSILETDHLKGFRLGVASGLCGGVNLFLDYLTYVPLQDTFQEVESIPFYIPGYASPYLRSVQVDYRPDLETFVLTSLDGETLTGCT